MITCKELPNQEFESIEQMFKAIIDNKTAILSLKKSAVKTTDGFNFGYITSEKENEVEKANTPVTTDANEVKVKVVMNTTNLLDSHGDVHIKDIWKRTLSHSSKKLHLQEHKRDFDKVISSDANAYTKTVSWKSLGADFEGNTQALIFDSVVKNSRNPLMFEQYKNGWVNNHSVGMQYVEFDICMNTNEDWAKPYKENWDKYYPDIANKEDADNRQYFWAITEAKLVEGSAVLFGSNSITPTLENNMKSALDAPLNDPSLDTQTEVKSYYSGLIKH